jgi:FOG: HEAT repeat
MIGDPGAVDPLIDALKNGDEMIRECAAQVLGMIGDPQAVEALVDALNDEEENVQRRAAEALGRIGGTAVDPLIMALNDSNSDVRRWAAIVLGGFGDPLAVEPLTYLASKDDNVGVREAATEALKKLGA